MAIATAQPMTVGRIRRIVSPVGPESSRRCGVSFVRSGNVLAPRSRAPARSHGNDGGHHRETGDRQERQRAGLGQGLELLDPSERGRPTQPVQADAGVGHESNGVAHTQHRSRVTGRLAARRRQLAGQSAHGEEHDGARDEGERKEQRRPGGDVDLGGMARDGGDERGDRPQDGHSRGESDDRLSSSTLPGGLAGEQELPPPGVLLTPQQPRARQQTPHGAEDHQCHRHLEHGEAGDGLEPGGGSEQGARGVVGPECRLQVLSLALGLVDRRIADRRRRHEDAEDVAPQDAGPDRPPGRCPGDDGLAGPTAPRRGAEGEFGVHGSPRQPGRSPS